MGMHEHCLNCFNMKCVHESLDIGDGCHKCSMVRCRHGCGFVMHECKHEDHIAYVCMQVITKCINSANGCPAEMARCKIGSHLQHCPASVVTCSHEWNRWRKSSTQEEEECNDLNHCSPAKNSDILDIALAERDQKRLDEALKMPKRLRKSLRNSYTVFPAVPFLQRPVSTEGVNPNGILSNSSSDALDDEFLDEEPCDHRPPGKNTVKVVQAVHCSLCKARAERNGDGLASSIYSALNKVTAVYVEDFQLENHENQKKDSGSKHHPHVDLTMEMFNSFRPKPRKMLTFLCAQDFRRDQFANHYKNVHCDIQSGLDGWYQVRCPLACYGCKYTTQRFVGSANQKIRYNHDDESFTAVYNTYISPSKDSFDWLSSLPDEVLLLILSYLDSQSLKSLSITSKVLRNICSTLLTKRGIVVLDWGKIDGRWTVIQKIWSFSTAFYPIESWKFSDGEALANHLVECPYFVKEYKYKPVRYTEPLVSE